MLVKLVYVFSEKFKHDFGSGPWGQVGFAFAQIGVPKEQLFKVLPILF